ncbi:MAG: rod shape-determining protein MreC [Lachnospiraceae bacterium]|nr:rod shape-determining protein MreC [Lachnospiraceae bacterium]
MMRGSRSGIPSKFILIILGIISVVFLFISYATGFSGGPLQVVADYVFIPMQRGIDLIGSSISVSSADAKTKQELVDENEALQAEVERLTNQLTKTQLQQSELETLQELFDLSQTYSEYPTTGAHVIARGTSNWFDTFTIDKGSNDGIKVNMNVIAGGGLVGIVTDVGKNYSVVRSIIDDTSNVSAMVLSTEDQCIISGDLQGMTEKNMIGLSKLEDSEGHVLTGDSVVTSNISDKYLQGILIGYIDQISDDENGLTKSGTITPVVDFRHLTDVLVILQLKETGE